jgi:hypothetical protein
MASRPARSGRRVGPLPGRSVPPARAPDKATSRTDLAVGEVGTQLRRREAGAKPTRHRGPSRCVTNVRRRDVVVHHAFRRPLSPGRARRGTGHQRAGGFGMSTRLGPPTATSKRRVRQLRDPRRATHPLEHRQFVPQPASRTSRTERRHQPGLAPTYRWSEKHPAGLWQIPAPLDAARAPCAALSLPTSVVRSVPCRSGLETLCPTASARTAASCIRRSWTTRRASWVAS